MTNYADTPRDRNIKDITAGEILLYGSSDGGTTWYPVKVDTGGNLQAAVGLTGTSRSMLTAAINFSTAIDSTIIAAVAASKIHLCGLLFTVGGETNITLKFGATAKTGAMDFGGTGEPKGIVAPIWFDIPLGTNEAFVIASSAAVQVSGWAWYYVVAD